MLRSYFKSDLPQLLAVETSSHAVPWTKDTFRMCFEAGYDGWVIEENKKLIGFIIVSAQVQECHILNICVAREHQRQGWGSKLLEQALKQVKANGIQVAYLEVRRTNTRAIALYQKMHFVRVGERKGYYPTEGGNEDALVFAKELFANQP